MRDEKRAVIREQNDRFRQGDLTIPGHRVFTSGVQALLEEQKSDLVKLMFEVESYNDFNTDNNPYGEHDFGMFTFGGEKLYWKIDYYAPDLMYGSEDASDLSKTMRVLTVLLSKEY